jgi:hypothetical protein
MGTIQFVIAELVSATALVAYPPPASQGLSPGPPRDRSFVAIPRRLRRPLHLPRIAPGSPCPVSGRHSVNSLYGPALGSGPVYPAAFDKQSTLYFGGASFPPPWTGNRVLWIVGDSYRGPVLIRGHQLGGRWWVGFEGGKRPASELRLDARRPGWKDFPTYTRVRVAGCYAYQIDGTSFSRVVVFRAAP